MAASTSRRGRRRAPGSTARCSSRYGRRFALKVSADTVFLPMRIRTKLSSQKVTSSGVYLENCKYVNYGLFGNLEVVSHQGFSTFLTNLEDCTSALNWKGSEK